MRRARRAGELGRQLWDRAAELRDGALGPAQPRRLVRIADEPGRLRAGLDESHQRVVAAAIVAEPAQRDREVPVVERPVGLGRERAIERDDRGGPATALVLREQG